MPAWEIPLYDEIVTFSTYVPLLHAYEVKFLLLRSSRSMTDIFLTAGI